MPTPSTTSAATNTGADHANATSGSPPHSTAAPSATAARLPIRVSSAPAPTSATTDPRARPKSPVARWPVVSPRCS
ncbi:hypothetical protein [Amycolatopsis sp. NPDC051061]|uniref:hypothetical protein n=1 Tax=Amycolatopsis sp. NPDC051061 TaxID=3155042 RepID=UPI0034349FF5